MVEIATLLFCLILAGLAVFQAALIAGAPIGNYAWGGAHTVLPASLKIGSAVSIILYAIFIIIVLSRVEILTLLNDSVANTGVWVLAVYFYIGVLMNGISRSKSERHLMTPVALVLAITCTIIALS
jgi:hypothetical protein